jgi:signal transduction histidine kinase
VPLQRSLVGVSPVWVSPRFRQLLSYNQESFPKATDPLSALLHPGDAPAFAAACSAHLGTNAAFDLEVRLRAADGLYRWVRVRAAAEPGSDARHATLSGSIRDVSRARAAEEALVAASKIKSELLANMSHEIRAPMNGVLGMTARRFLERPGSWTASRPLARFVA